MKKTKSCLDCNFFNWGKGDACDAFPKGIPFEIKNGEFSHNKLHPKQKNDVIFEPIKE